MELYAQTISDANDRIANNTAALEETNTKIAHQEALLAEATEDERVAQEDLDAETARWDHETEVHLDLMAELEAELAAVDACIDIFASSEMGGLSSTLGERLNAFL